MRFIHEIEESFKFCGGAVVKELCSAMNQSSPQMRLDSDNQNVFSWLRVFGALRNAQIILFNQNFGKY